MGVYYIGSIPCSGGDIYHYGRKGMKWGKNIFGDLADRLSGAAKNAVSKVSDWSGYSARANRDHYSNVAKNTKGWWNAGARGAAENKASAYNAQYKNSPMGRIEGAANAVREQAQQAMSKAREQVSKAYADAAEKAGGAGKNIQAFYADVMSKAKTTISKGKNLVSKYGPQFVSQIQTLGNNALAGGKSFLEGIMKKAKQAKSEFSKGPEYLANKAKSGVKSGLSKARQSIETEGNRAREAVTEYVTGSNAKTRLAKAERRYRGASSQNRHATKAASRNGGYGISNHTPSSFTTSKNEDRAREEYESAQREYDRTLPGQLKKVKKKLRG